MEFSCKILIITNLIFKAKLKVMAIGQVQEYAKKKNLISFTKLKLLKIKNLKYPFWRFDKEKSIQLIKQGGWHFTYLMTPKNISMKVNDMVYQNLNIKKYNSIKLIKKKIECLEDLFDRGFILKKVKIDKTFPTYLKENIKYYKKWIY